MLVRREEGDRAEGREGGGAEAPRCTTTYSVAFILWQLSPS